MTYKELDMPHSGDTVAVAMSGGVDSTYAALMLHEAGCRVVGVTMAIWDASYPLEAAHTAKHPSCYSRNEADEIEAVRDFCGRLGIRHCVIDLRAEYRKEVIEYFKAEYRRGRTPNPCIRCNRALKFGALWRAAQRMGVEADYICTGHYARVVQCESPLWGGDKQPAMVARAVDKTKDQSYFLCNVPSGVLSRVRFPLGNMTKEEVKEAAKLAKLEAAECEESQDFMGGAQREALFGKSGGTTGDIVDESGNVIGHHNGIEHYTVGQRRGLGVAAGVPIYVKAIDAQRNTLVVCEDAGLMGSSLAAENAVWPAGIAPAEAFEADVKIRLRTPAVRATVVPNGNTFTVHFNHGVRAIAAGQSAVIYIDDVVYGAGEIAKGEC